MRFSRRFAVAATATAVGFSCLGGVAQAQPVPTSAQQVVSLAHQVGASETELQKALRLLSGNYTPDDFKPDRLSDPFFDRPSVVSGNPGTVVQTRDVSRTATASVNADGDRKPDVVVKATQYKFVTRDSHGLPDMATATLLVPASKPTPVHILAFQDATDSAGLGCMPGAKLAAGTDFDLHWGLSKGYGVLVADHDGLDAEYAATRQTGHIALDAMRVVARQRPAVDFISVGYSGGGLTNYGASMLQNEYAPELNGRVTAYFSGGTPASLSAVAAHMDGDFLDSGILFAAILGASREYPQLYTLYNPLGRAVAYLMRNACLQEFALLGTLSLSIDTFAYPGALYSKVAQGVFADTYLGGAGRVVPADLLIYHSAGDEMIPYPQARAWYVEQFASRTPSRSREMLTGSGSHSDYGQAMQPQLQHKISTEYWPVG